MSAAPQPSPAGPRIVRDPERLAHVLTPIRRRLLRALAEPDSASGLARRLDLPRQKVNYHLRELEKHGFLELVEERQRRGCVERCLAVTAHTWLVDPRLLGDLAGPPESAGDQASAAYLLQAAARSMSDVAALREGAAAAGKRLTTLTLEGQVRFADRASHRAFCEELAGAVAGLLARYDAPAAPGARTFQLTTLLHPERRPDAGAASSSSSGASETER